MRVGKPPACSLLIKQLAGNQALLGRSVRPDDVGKVTIPTPSPDKNDKRKAIAPHVDREAGNERSSFGGHRVPPCALHRRSAACDTGAVNPLYALVIGRPRFALQVVGVFGFGIFPLEASAAARRFSGEERH